MLSISSIGMTYHVIEGESIGVNLTSKNSSIPFPPIINTQLYFGNQLTINKTDTYEGLLTFELNSINRSQSGVYSYIVFNDAGNFTGNFTINVLCKFTLLSLCYD